jgi:hypothetical protein
MTYLENIWLCSQQKRILLSAIMLLHFYNISYITDPSDQFLCKLEITLLQSKLPPFVEAESRLKSLRTREIPTSLLPQEHRIWKGGEGTRHKKTSLLEAEA